MNTKDREYIQELNTSLATLSEKISRYGVTLSEVSKQVEGVREALKIINGSPVTVSIDNLPEQTKEEVLKGGWLESPLPATVAPVQNLPKHESSIENFTMKDSGTSLDKFKRAEKGTSSRSVNKFVDDGSLHKDAVNNTPEVKLSTKGTRKKFSKVDQVCSRCSKTFSIHPHHARDNFACDNCLKR